MSEKDRIDDRTEKEAVKPADDKQDEYEEVLLYLPQTGEQSRENDSYSQ